MRLIDADVLESALVENVLCIDVVRNVHYADVVTRQAIESTPTVKIGNVKIEDVRHGEWIRNDETFTRYKCSCCGVIKPCFIRMPYCCNCGAKMDGNTNIDKED